MIQSLLIALVISIDAFAGGLAFGIKNIRIKKLTLIIMGVVNVGVLSIAMFFGNLAGKFIGQNTASIVSFFILVFLGCFYIIQGYIKYLIEKKSLTKDKKLAEIKLSQLGIIVDIMIDYTKADINVSGEIDFKEAIYLSMALSLDSLGVGFGSAIGNIHHLQVISFAFILNLLAISTGLALGRKITNYNKNLKTFWISGAILIILGISKLT